MQIKITHSPAGLWYRDKLGETFHVERTICLEDSSEPLGYMVRGDDSLGGSKLLNIIYCEHCKEV